MKIKIAFTEAEKQQAQEVAAAIREKLEPDAFVNEKHSDTHKPYFHTYISTRNSRENT